jgi:cytochrome b-561
MTKSKGGLVDARTLVAHVLAAGAVVLVLMWCIHFRGGALCGGVDGPR